MVPQLSHLPQKRSDPEILHKNPKEFLVTVEGRFGADQFLENITRMGTLRQKIEASMTALYSTGRQKTSKCSEDSSKRTLRRFTQSHKCGKQDFGLVRNHQKWETQ